jgi:hypothetical protein
VTEYVTAAVLPASTVTFGWSTLFWIVQAYVR